jgi:hypothetical protein
MKIPKTDVNNFYNGSNGGAASGRSVDAYLTTLVRNLPQKSRPKPIRKGALFDFGVSPCRAQR